MGSEDTHGISTTIVDEDDDSLLDISPGEDDKIEEEIMNKSTTSSVTPTSSPFGSPSSIYNTPTTPSTGLPFGSPSTTPQWNSGMFGVSNNNNSFGSSYTPPSTSIWGTNNNSNNYGWGSNNNSSPGWSWGNNNNNFNSFNNSSNWGSGWGNHNTMKPGNAPVINKRLVFCSFFDTIVCSLGSFNNGRFTIINQVPSDISDLYIRKEVLFKMSRITADAIVIIVPREFIRGLVCNSSLNEKRGDDLERDMNTIVNYLRMGVMTYMKHTISDAKYCQFILVSDVDYRNISNIICGELQTINSVSNNFYTNDKVVFLGANGGANGYGLNDKLIAETCKIDFLDTNILLNS